ncbi:MAG TPA: pitrilysin family protein [Vicinamibacterales bacterium]|jgi:predicted Zn-dependent peptidase
MFRIAVLAIFLTTVPLGAVTPPKVAFTYTRLSNGLRVVISEDHSAPVFSIAVNYNVGSRDERKGRTGFAHLFEHMMFKGSENVGTGEHFVLVFNNGGDMNGTTNQDRTVYYERLPANQLDLALYLESDRMRSLAVTQDNLDNQRQAVQEERRLRVDNQPYGRTYETILELAYENFAYEHSPIGSMADLDAATLDDVRAFFKTYYAPNNAVLSIVGDVNPKETLAKVQKYFGSIPSQPPPPVVDMTEPPQRAEKRTNLEDSLARLTSIDIVYHMPPAITQDADALSVLASVLAAGRSSRMYQALVREKQLAVAAGARSADSRGPGLFSVGVTVAPGKSATDTEAAVYEEIERVKTGAIAAWELEKARNNAKRAVVGTLTSSLQRALLLSQYALFHDNPDMINTRYQRVEAISTADLQRVAREYLTEANRTVVITVPKPPTSPANPGGAR